MSYGGGNYHIQDINQSFGQILSVSTLKLDSNESHVGCQVPAIVLALFPT